MEKLFDYDVAGAYFLKSGEWLPIVGLTEKERTRALILADKYVKGDRKELVKVEDVRDPGYKFEF